jgi:hypothetical protein
MSEESAGLRRGTTSRQEVSLHCPGADWERGLGIGKLRVHGRGNEDAPIKLRKYAGRFNQDKVIERCCVSDNRLHLQTELAVGFAVAFEVFLGVFQFDAMVL